MSKAVHVAVGIVLEATSDAQRVLVALRPQAVHQGGLWEFPGGKVESGETVADALGRELKEELDIQVESCEPALEIRHDYPDKTVILDVWWVTEFSGVARGREGQPLQWADKATLKQLNFPEANTPITELVCRRLAEVSLS